MAATDLISSAYQYSAPKIFVHDGVTSILQTYFAAVSRYTCGIAIDSDGNLISAVYSTCNVHQGLSTVITSTFNFAPISYPSWGLTWDGSNVMGESCHTVPMNRITQYVGKTSVVGAQLTLPIDKKTENRGLAWDGVNVISSHASVAGLIYIHNGWSTIISSSFAPPASGHSGVAWKSVGSDLISCIEGTPSKVYTHSGKTSTISSSFNYPAPGAVVYAPRGLAMGEYGVATETKDFTYRYDILDYDLVPQDFPYSYEIGSLVFQDFPYSYDIRFPHADLAYSYDINVGNDFSYLYDIFDWGTLIIGGKASQTVYFLDGLSTTILDTMPYWGSPIYDIQGLGWDGDTFEGNLLSATRRAQVPTNVIARHLGSSTIITESFLSPFGYPTSVAYDGTTFVSTDGATGKVYVHDEVSSVILDSFRVGRVPWGVEIDGDGNLITYESYPGWHWIQIHDGVSSTITDSFRPWIYPPLYLDIKDITIARRNIVFVENWTQKVYVLDGFTSTVNFFFNAPDTECQGITYGALFPAVRADFPYSYNVGLSNVDFPYSYDIAAVRNDLPYSYDINVAADFAYSYDLGLFKDLTYAYSILSYYSGLQELTDLQIYIVDPLSILVDLLAWVCSEISPMFDLEIVIAQFFQDDIDVQIRSGRTVPAHRIQILIDGIIHNLDADEIDIGIINQYLEKDYGVSRIGNVRIYLTNTADKFSVENPSSLIADEDYIWTWIRIRSGWGPDLETDIETQFQGKLYELITTESYGCVLAVYDPIKDLMDWETTADITFNAALVAGTDLISLNPLHIIKYLIEDVYVKNGTYGLKWFDFDTSTYTDIIESTSFTSAYEATIHTTISSTLWEKGSNLLEMIQDLLKIVGGYMFTAPDGKLKFYVPSPARSFGTVNSYTGNIDAEPRQLFTSNTRTSYDSIYNEIIWTVGPSDRTVGPFSATSSIGRFGKRTKEIATKWEVADEDLELLSDRLLTRFSEPLQELDGVLSYIEAGTALSEELGNVVNLTDQAHSVTSKFFEITKIGKNLPNESVEIETRDASQMAGKFMIACSTIDHGDGYGITANNFDLWVERFGFAGWAYATDPHNSGSDVGFDPEGNHNHIIDPDYGTQDRWGNGIEEIFVAW